MNDRTATNALLVSIVPPLAGVALVTAFTALGLWQLDRAAEKEALAEKFANDAPYRSLDNVDVENQEPPIPFEKLEVRGRPLSDRQVLIDNIVRNGRIGYFVITPFEITGGAPLLLVNRGWVDKGTDADITDRIGGTSADEGSADEGSADEGSADEGSADSRRRVRGRAGHLPRVGIRSGEAFAGALDWPRVAVYPTLAEVAEQLDRELLPFVLLLDPDDADGFMRAWEPAQSGPMTHYGYAFQWFAMALAVVAIGGWQLKKRLSAG